MTARLGDWVPGTDAERLDRLESLAAITQLAVRYALAVDSKDVDALCDLFVPDVRVTATTTGRAALGQWFVEVLAGFRASVHSVGNHVVDFIDGDNARGVVYTRDQLERRDVDRWMIGEIQYWDRYRRIDGTWYFVGRKFLRVYLVDALDRPAGGAGVTDGESLPAGLLPEAHPTWRAFVAEHGIG